MITTLHSAMAYLLAPGCLDGLQLGHLSLYCLLRLALLLLGLLPLLLQLLLHLQHMPCISVCTC